MNCHSGYEVSEVRSDVLAGLRVEDEVAVGERSKAESEKHEVDFVGITNNELAFGRLEPNSVRSGNVPLDAAENGVGGVHHVRIHPPEELQARFR